MRSALRVCFSAVFTAAILAVAASAQERVTLRVNTPVHIAQQTLEPGSYEVATTPARGVFVITARNTASSRTKFLNTAGVAEDSARYGGRPAVVVKQSADGELVITGVYFPQTGLTYMIPVPARTEAGVPTKKPLR